MIRLSAATLLYNIVLLYYNRKPNNADINALQTTAATVTMSNTTISNFVYYI